jgi:hypothetical protein
MHTDLSENLEISDDECDLGEQTLSVNTVNVHLEISSVYRASLEKLQMLSFQILMLNL